MPRVELVVDNPNRSELFELIECIAICDANIRILELGLPSVHNADEQKELRDSYLKRIEEIMENEP